MRSHEHPSVSMLDARVVVVVPARNEAATVGEALRSIGDAVAEAGVPGWIVVVDDDSSDGTAEVAAATLAARPVLRTTVLRGRHGRASSAREAGVRAVDSLPGSAVLLSTDADSVVEPDWVRRHLDHHDRGAVAVAGIVDLLDDGDPDLRRRWAEDYGSTLHADGSHPHVHAANLSVRLDRLRAVGGFGSAARAEDIDLWRRLRAVGETPVHDSSIVVWTSARLTGRVERGFATAIRRYAVPERR